MRAIVFVGPTLPPRLRPVDPIWEWRPPVRQGDVYRAALTRPDAIGIIDGYFESVPTVWHKEILWAMAEGIPVFGAASIGALRAAELDSFGMIGVGRIYEDFRDGILQDDDEVAVLHGPEELGYPALTEAMVNIRATLANAVVCEVLAWDRADAIAAYAKQLFYKDRTYERLVADMRLDHPAQIHRWLISGTLDNKHNDALSMLARIRADLSVPTPRSAISFELAETVAWNAARILLG